MIRNIFLVTTLSMLAASVFISCGGNTVQARLAGARDYYRSLNVDDERYASMHSLIASVPKRDVHVD